MEKSVCLLRYLAGFFWGWEEVRKKNLCFCWFVEVFPSNTMCFFLVCLFSMAFSGWCFINDLGVSGEFQYGI